MDEDSEFGPDTELTYSQYVEVMSMLLSGDPKQVADANWLLYALLVRGPDAGRIPAVALHEIETGLERARVSRGRSTRPKVPQTKPEDPQ